MHKTIHYALVVAAGAASACTQGEVPKVGTEPGRDATAVVADEGQPSIERRVKSLVAEQLGVPLANVALASSLVDDLGIDSLDCVETVMATEEAFKLDIPDEDAEKWLTVRDIVSYVEARSKAK
jgi:acyl carrier protein